MALEMQVETITPQRAAEYLRHNTNNYRKISRATVAMYAQDIEAGRWQLNGEPIVFGVDGILKNGQHRLAAIVKSNKPVNMVVVRGVDSDVSVFDVGKVRSAQQLVEANGYTVNNSVVSAVSLLLNQVSPPPKSYVSTYVQEHHSELMRAYRAATAGIEKICRKSSCILASYLMLRTQTVPYYEIEIFFRIFATKTTAGTDGYNPSSAFVARKMFDDRQGRTGRSVQREELEILILALTDFHAKKSREKNYHLKQPLVYEEYLKKVAKTDGIEI